MADKTRHLNDQVAAARAKAETHLPALEQAYTTLLRKAGRGAAENFRNLTVTAAANPEQWQPPNQNLVAGDQLETDAVNQIPPIHRRMLDDATPAEELGISFALNQPAPQVLLAKLSKRLGTLGDAIGKQVDEAVSQGYQEGWSVARTADEILAKTDMIAPVRAEALARTDLNALSNGTSLSLASQIDGVSTKTWLATDDERTRESHADADGQTVPIDQPFDVGGEQAQYPGDPDLSDGESFNCRCTVIYGDNITASADSTFDALAMVALYPRPGEAEALAIADGQDPASLHVTLLFLGAADSFDEQTVLDVVAQCANTMGPLAGQIGGVAMFAEGDNGVPIILLPDVQGLGAVQQAVEQTLRMAGVESPSEHGFLPHLTLTYADNAAMPSLDQIGAELHFDCLSVSIGTRRFDFPLSLATSAEGGDMSTTVDHATVPPEGEGAAETAQLAALRELVPGLADVEDRTVLALHTLVLAARKQHAYRGDGGPCVLCDQPASDDAAHYQALTAGLSAFTIVAAAGPGEPTRWVAPAIAVENQPTEDGRILMAGSVTWRDGVLPLGIMLETPHSDMATAPLCGGIDRLERIGDVIAAAGFFNDNSADETLAGTARLAIDAVRSQTAKGISVDLMVLEGDLIMWPPVEELDDAGEEELPPEIGEEMVPTLVDPDGDGDIDLPGETDDDGRLLMAVYEGVIGGACIVPVPAIANASLSIVAAAAGSFELLKVTTPLIADCGCGDLEVPVSLVAAAAPLAPPREWFEAPELDVPTPLTVTDDGRVFGHIALWNSCHEGFAGRCVPPPRQSDGFRKFHNGDFKTADGSRIPVGKLTLKAGHASIRVSEEAARAHYDNTATIGAFIRASNGKHGIWVAGALKSDLQPELVRDLMASPPSGDWRGHELVAAHAVIDPGFPVLRASGFGDLLEWDDDVEVAVPVSPLTHLRPGRRTRAA